MRFWNQKNFLKALLGLSLLVSSLTLFSRSTKQPKSLVKFTGNLEGFSMKDVPLSESKIKSATAFDCIGRLRFEAPPGFNPVGDYFVEWNAVSLEPVGSAVELQAAIAELRAQIAVIHHPAHASSALQGESLMQGGGVAFSHHVSRYDEPASGLVTALFPAGDVLVRAKAGYGRTRDHAAALAEVLRLAKAAGPMPSAGSDVAGLCLGTALFRVPMGRTENASSTWRGTQDDGVILQLQYSKNGAPYKRPTSNRPVNVKVGAHQFDGETAETLVEIVEGRRGHAILGLQIPRAGATSMQQLSVELRRLSGGPSDEAPARVLRAWFDRVLVTLRTTT
jgi:hypothetical protein